MNQLKRGLLFVSMIVVSLGGFSIAGAADLRLPVPQQETLPNGLTLVWFLNDKLPIVDLALLVKSGYRDDPAGKSGTAELVASLLERGAGGMTAQQLAQSIERLGASRYSSAEEDTFSIGMHGLAPDAPVLLDLLGKIALHPDFPEAEVSREHARLLDRWSHIGDYGETLAGLAYHRILASGTSYGRGSFLSIQEFGKVKREDVLNFHQKHFTPKNSVLMIVGRVNQPEFRQKIVEAFGQWQGEAPKREWKNYVDKRMPHGRNEIVLVDRPNLTQAQVRIGFRAPLINAPEHYPLVVANALLGEYFNSRLNALIRDKLGLTYSIGSSFSYSKDIGIFSIASATRNEAVGQLIQKAVDVLRDLKQGSIPAAEIQMAKEYLEGGFPLSTSTLSSVAARWLAGYIYDMGPDYLNEFVPKVRMVTTDSVAAAVTKDFDLSRLTIVVAGNGQEISKSIAQAKLNRTIKRVSEKDLR